MLARALHRGDVAAVPHPWAAQLAQVMEAAGDPGQQAELVEEAAGLEQTDRQDQKWCRDELKREADIKRRIRTQKQINSC